MPETIESKYLHNIMGQSYINYSMSVISDRALPDIRDGLKPVQRRILWAMHELKNYPTAPHRKCARIVGDTIGKLHPHGEAAIYGALVYLAQPWASHRTLIDGHGNFGNLDGEGAAAMRYTEARLSKLAMEMLRDVECDTVKIIPNFDNTEVEPVVLPARFPNLLVNGTQGIAVGMASNMPPHNLGESIDGCVAMLDAQMNNSDITNDELLEYIKGPDFPTGAVILGNSYKDVYRTGKGKIEMECVYHIEPNGKNKENIIIDEIPFRVNKRDLIIAIADRVKDTKMDVTDIRDESSREGIRIVIELKKGAIADIIINDLKKHTQLRSNFNANMLCIVDGRPKCLDLHDIIMYYLKHQEEIVSRRTKYELDKAMARIHIVEGLLKAIEHIDEIIALIKAADDAEGARASLMEKFGFTEIQAQYIVEMKLRSLAGLETQKLKDEMDALNKKIANCNKILGSRKELLKLIKKELLEIKKKHATPRKTEHVMDYSDITMEDIISNDEVIIIRSAMGYIKRIRPEQFRAQKKGGMGSKGIATIENDYITDIIRTTAHAPIMFFTSAGRGYMMKAYQIPESNKNTRGTALVSLLKLPANETITNVASYSMTENDFLMIATKNGMVKRIDVSTLPDKIRSTGLILTNLNEGDEVRSVAIVKEDDNVMLVTKDGQCLCYPVSNVRPMGRTAAGVHGMKLNPGDEVVNMQPQQKDHSVIIVTEKAYAKRIDSTQFKEFKTRNGKGQRAIQAAKMVQTGKIISVMNVDNEDADLVLITDSGKVLRTPVAKIPVYSRVARGVRTMKLPDGVNVADATQIDKAKEEDVALFDDELITNAHEELSAEE